MALAEVRHAARERWRGWLQEADSGRPVEETEEGRLRRAASTSQSLLAFALLDLNDWLIGRFQGHLPSVWSTADFPWIADIEARHPEIKAEVQQYLDRVTLPHVAVMSGLDPEADVSKVAVPGINGTWRALLLHTCGRWIPETARHFPVTRSCFPDLRHKAHLGFSALEPHSHIEPHVGSNRGALRLQVPIIVPGKPGDCRIRVGEEVLVWEEGKAVVFDLKTDHEAWNDADELRVLLMVEIEPPLAQPFRTVNRLAQRAYRWHPSYRKMPGRVARIGLSLDEVAARVATARAAEAAPPGQPVPA